MRLIILRPDYSFHYIKFTYESPEKLLQDLELSVTELGRLERKSRYLKMALNATYNLGGTGLDEHQLREMIEERKRATEEIRKIKPIKSDCGKLELAHLYFMDMQGNYIKPQIYTLEEWFDRD